MRAFSLLPLLVIYLFQSNSCDDFLSKFHQQKYKLRDERVELVRFDKAYYDIFKIKGFKYNRTTVAHNFTMRPKVEMQDKVEVLFQFYKFLSNEYRHFPMRYQYNLKKSIKANIAGTGEMLNCGNFSTYFKKDTTYHYCNMVIDATHLPPLIPNGIYRANIEFVYLDKSTSLTYYYLEVYTPIAYPKK